MAIDAPALQEEDLITFLSNLLITQRYVSPVRLVVSKGTIHKERNREIDEIRRNRDEIARRLDAVGFELVLDRHDRFAHAAPHPGSAQALGSLTLNESKFLLALALLYQREQGNLGRHDTLDANIQSLLHVLTLEFHAFPSRPGKTVIKQIMQRFERCNLVQRRGGKWEDEDVDFTILPTISRFSEYDLTAAFKAAYECDDSTPACGDETKTLDCNQTENHTLADETEGKDS